jgi:enoyl-CoA hydratase/carnithine racemase
VTQYETLRYEERNGVAWVTLNRPDVLNAVNDAMQAELRDVWRSLRASTDIGCVVVTGEGERAFTTGRDRSEALTDVDPSRRAGFLSTPFHPDDSGEHIGPRSADLWIPVVVAVNGMACGNAFFLVGEADIVIAADHATFFDPHVTFGLTSMYEAAQLAHRVPFGEVARIALLGSHERMSAARAYDIGLISEVVPMDRLHERAGWIAEAIASQPRLAVQATVRSLWMARELSRAQSLAMGWSMIALGNQPEAREEGLRAFASGQRIEWQLR